MKRRMVLKRRAIQRVRERKAWTRKFNLTWIDHAYVLAKRYTEKQAENRELKPYK